MYCQATQVSYNDKLNFPSTMKNLFHSVDPLYISDLIFHNFLYRPYGVLIIPPQCLINALQKHNFSPSSNSFRSIPIPPPSTKPSLIIPVNKSSLSWIPLIFIFWTSYLLIIILTCILLNRVLWPLVFRPTFHVNSWENLGCRKYIKKSKMWYIDNLSRYFYFLL